MLLNDIELKLTFSLLRVAQNVTWRGGATKLRYSQYVLPLLTEHKQAALSATTGDKVYCPRRCKRRGTRGRMQCTGERRPDATTNNGHFGAVSRSVAAKSSAAGQGAFPPGSEPKKQDHKMMAVDS